jgi:hypothetical protein
MSDNILFYIDPHPHPVELKSMITLNTEICTEEDRELVADLVTHIFPLSAPMRQSNSDSTASLSSQSVDGIADIDYQSQNCRNYPKPGGCGNPDCESVLNFRWSHRKDHTSFKVRGERIYFCSVPCAESLGYTFEDLKLGCAGTLPKSYREICHFLQKDFCCRLHKFKFYESICILNFFAQKGKIYKKDLVPNWDKIEVLLRKLNLPGLTKLLFHYDLKRPIDDPVSEQVAKKAKLIGGFGGDHDVQ